MATLAPVAAAIVDAYLVAGEYRAAGVDDAPVVIAFFPVGDQRRDGSIELPVSAIQREGVDHRHDRCGEPIRIVAAGRTDGFWELGLSTWDIAAGVLLVREAGGFVGDWRGGDTFMKTGNIVAANPKLFKAMVQDLRPHLTEAIV